MTNEQLEQLVLTMGDKFNTLITLMTDNNKPNDCKYTLYSWLDEWFATYKVPNLKDRGYDMGNNIRKHVKPNIENNNLSAVTSLEITKALNKVKSERMRQLTYCIYNQAFTKAVEINLIAVSPMTGVDTIDHDYENGRTLEIFEQKEFLYECKKDKKLSALFQFYLYSGARPSEPFTIKWTDVKENSFRINGTKTKTSNRELPMFPELRKLFDSIPKKSDYVFPFNYYVVHDHFELVRKRLSFYKVQVDKHDHIFTLKDLRHTFGTRCIEAGVNMKTVQKWLGHSNYKTTESIYTHITTDFEKDEIARFCKKIVK